jgi:hypothetical protein
MKRERGDDDDNKNECEIHIQVMNIGPQMNACKGMLMILVDPDGPTRERAHSLAVDDITAIRALRKTIGDNLVPKLGSIDEWKSAIASAVDSFCSMPVKYMMMRDPNDEEGFKSIAAGIREILQGKSISDLNKKQDEEEEKKKQKEDEKEQKEPEPDTKNSRKKKIKKN